MIQVVVVDRYSWTCPNCSLYNESKVPSGDRLECSDCDYVDYYHIME